MDEYIPCMDYVLLMKMHFDVLNVHDRRNAHVTCVIGCFTCNGV